MPPRKKINLASQTSPESDSVEEKSSEVPPITSKLFGLEIDRTTFFLGLLYSTYMGCLANPHKRLSDGFTADNEKQANYELELIFDLTMKSMHMFESKLMD